MRSVLVRVMVSVMDTIIVYKWLLQSTRRKFALCRTQDSRMLDHLILAISAYLVISIAITLWLTVRDRFRYRRAPRPVPSRWARVNIR